MSSTETDEIIEHIKQDMRQAMKNSERTTAETLKSLLARISNAEAVHPTVQTNDENTIAGAVKGVGNSEVQRKILTLSDLQSIMRAEQEEMEAALLQIDSNSEYAQQLQEKIAVINIYRL